MMIDPARMDWSRLVPFAILGASIAALVTAYTAELVFGIEPCVLCLYQRIPYALAGALAVAALLAPGTRPKVWAVIGAGVAFLAGAEIAFYHVGVEQHWWRSVAACAIAPADPEPETVEELRRLLTEVRPVARACDVVNWSLFGVSMATYNVAASLALAAGSFWGAEKMRRQA